MPVRTRNGDGPASSETRHTSFEHAVASKVNINELKSPLGSPFTCAGRPDLTTHLSPRGLSLGFVKKPQNARNTERSTSYFLQPLMSHASKHKQATNMLAAEMQRF